MPATSYFDASKAGPALSDLFDDGHRAWGRFWTSDKDGLQLQGRIIQIDTQYKKVSRENAPFVDAMPIRPMSTN